MEGSNLDLDFFRTLMPAYTRNEDLSWPEGCVGESPKMTSRWCACPMCHKSVPSPKAFALAEHLFCGETWAIDEIGIVLSLPCDLIPFSYYSETL